MNTEIPKGLKEYVFALYIGQKVEHTFHDKAVGILYGFIKTEDYTVYSGDTFHGIFDNICLQLRALSSITDSEAIEVAYVFGKYIGWHTVTRHAECITVHANNNTYLQIWFDGSFRTNIKLLSFEYAHAYQYLQQQGFALPVYYDGHLFSVADLEQMQIIKLIE